MKVLKDSKLGDLKLSTVHTKPKKVNQPVNSFFNSELFCVCTLKLEGTGGPRIVLFLRTQGTVLLTKPYYSGTDLVLK